MKMSMGGSPETRRMEQWPFPQTEAKNQVHQLRGYLIQNGIDIAQPFHRRGLESKIITHIIETCTNVSFAIHNVAVSAP